MMEIVKEAAFYICFFFFVLGLLCTVTSGSLKALKICISVFSLLFLILCIIALVFSQGFVIFLIPQLITLAIIFIIVITLGAALGYWIFIRFVKDGGSSKLSLKELDHYVTIGEFCSSQDMSEEKVLKRLKSGFYRGGRLRRKWYVHKTELSS